MARLTAAQRNALPASAFAGPNRSYPVNDPNHARAALSMSARFAPPATKKKVKAKVHKRFPTVGMSADAKKKLVRMVQS